MLALRRALSWTVPALLVGALACHCTPGATVSASGGAGDAGHDAGHEGGVGGGDGVGVGGGSASGAGGAVPFGADAWARDESAWSPVPSPAFQVCDVRAAILPNAAAPVHGWTPCGTGCEETAPTWAGWRAPSFGFGATELGGELYYRVVTMVDDQHNPPESVALYEVRRLAGDQLVAGFRTNWVCSSAIDPRGAFLFAWAQTFGDFPPFAAVGRVASPALDGQLVPSEPPLDLGGGQILFVNAKSFWGVLSNLSAMKVATNPTSTALTDVFGSLALQVAPSTRDDMLIWTDWTGVTDASTQRAVLRVWTPSAGTVALVEGSHDAVDHAMTGERIYWIEASSPTAFSGPWGTGTLWYSPRTADPLQIVRNEGPLIPHATAGSAGFVAYGSKAAVLANDGVSEYLDVIDVDAQKTWVIKPRAGHVLFRLLGMDAHYILVVEYALPGTGLYADRLIRFDVEKLDELQNGWN